MKNLKIACLIALWSATAFAEMPLFAEDQTESEWSFDWSGYARLPLRLVDGPTGTRGPYLIDDHFTQSGFAYLRVNEREWIEVFLSAKRGNTRVVLGLQTSELSDWGYGDGQEPSPRTSPALAFVEQTLGDSDGTNARLRIGMTWERLGYIEPYDTYLIGRTHLAGASTVLNANRWLQLSGGLGVYSRDRLRQTRSSLLGWTRLSGFYKNLRLDLYALSTKTEPDDREFGATEYDRENRGQLDVIGAQLKYQSKVVSAQYLLGFYDATDVEYLGNSVELLHAEGGLGLRRHYLFATEENRGTGQLQAQAFDVKLKIDELSQTLSIHHPILTDWQWRIFGMTTWVATNEDDVSDATLTENGRVYWKWGSEFRPSFAHFLPKSRPYLGFRFDRVALHHEQDSMAFRVLSLAFGINPQPGMEIFAQWSRYTYGDDIVARDEVRQRVGETTRPDDQAFKIQTQVRW